MPFAIPGWLKIVGPLLAVAIAIALLLAWGNGRYRDGKRDGVFETDQKWQAASDKLKAEAKQSATRADDAAVKRLETEISKAREDQERIDEANRNGTSPLDALFGS